MKVSQAIKVIRDTVEEKENIYTCYVISEDRKLEGVVSLKELITSEDDVTIESIMNRNFVSAHANDDQEMVADVIKKYDLIILPVVDIENRLLGIITIDDIIDVIEQEVEKLVTRGPKRVSPFYIPAAILNMASGNTSIYTGAKGPNKTVVTACASGTNSIGDAFQAILLGKAHESEAP